MGNVIWKNLFEVYTSALFTRKMWTEWVCLPLIGAVNKLERVKGNLKGIFSVRVTTVSSFGTYCYVFSFHF